MGKTFFNLGIRGAMENGKVTGLMTVINGQRERRIFWDTISLKMTASSGWSSMTSVKSLRLCTFAETTPRKTDGRI